MGIVVHRIDAPFVTGPVMGGVQDAVHDRVSQIQIGRGHVDLGPQRFLAIRELTAFHPGKEIQILCHGAIAKRAVESSRRQRKGDHPNQILTSARRS